MFCILQPLLKRVYRLLSRVKVKYVCFGFVIIVMLDFFGVFTHVFEITYDEKFTYPYDGDVDGLVSQIRNNEQPDLEPINEYNYTFIYDIKEKCSDPGYEKLRIILIVKSAVENFAKRDGIRNSWGFEKRFYDVPMRTVFLVGRHRDDIEIQSRIKAEATKYRDVVQFDFIDAYFNNTIKTMMGFKWAVQYCGNSKFYMFVDDDMYISVKNVLKFVRHPTQYPEYLKNSKDVFEVSKKNEKNEKRWRREIVTASYENTTSYVDDKSKNRTNIIIKIRSKRQIFDFELPDDVRLFAGYVFNSSPHRHKSSKWYVSLDEYPYHMWPPYVTAGAYILSREALFDMYYYSLYTKHFRFDDIYLGLVAKKAEIEPFHSDDFYFYKKDYNKFSYKYVVASHGYGDPNELIKVWNEQKAMGYA